jgi:PAS domain S-box-containing protein
MMILSLVFDPMDQLWNASLTNQAQILGDILDNLPVALFAKDASDDYRFVLWNKKQEDVTTIPREKALGKNDMDLFSAESARYFREIDEAVVRRGKLFEIPEEIVDTQAGGEVYLRTVKVPVVREDRVILVGISEDITERVRGKEQLMLLNKNLSEKNKELELTQQQLFQAEKLESIGRLAAGVAHEVKNPLALLLLGVDYLSSGIDPADPNIDVILKEMRYAIERADKIVRGLLDFSSDRQIQKESADPVELFERALVLIRHELNLRSVAIEKSFSSDGLKVKVDQGKFEQVLINLLMNAIHAIGSVENPSLKLTIRVDSLTEVARNEGDRTVAHFRKGDKVVIFQIIDNGCGIKEEDLPRVFDPFFTTKATGVGTGLGLSVVRKIVELHQGRISIQNRRTESGVIVQIALPATQFTEFD